MRAGLVALLIAHVAIALHLVAVNRAARPVGYAVYRPVVSTRAGRAMALAWARRAGVSRIFHILHFTLGQVQPRSLPRCMDPKARWDAYSMYVHGFQNPGIYVAYLVGIGLLATHLGHGAASWLQTLGVRHPKYPTDRLGPVIAATLFVGYMIPPTAVLAGLIRLPGA